MMARYIYSFFLFLAPILLPAVIIPMIPGRVSDYYLRELTYLYIANANNGVSARDTLINNFNYVADNLSTISSPVLLVDRTPYNDLVRGYGFCDQQGFLLMTLLAKSGIKSRLVDVQAHTHLEVLIDDKYVLADPYYEFLPYGDAGDMLSLNELDKVKTDERHVLQKDQNDSFDSKDYRSIYVPNPIRWPSAYGPSYEEYRNSDLPRKFIDLYASMIMRFSKKYYYLVQDIYFLVNDHFDDPTSEYVSNSGNYITNDVAYSLFFKARNFHIADRHELANPIYESIMNNYPNSYWSERAGFFWVRNI